MSRPILTVSISLILITMAIVAGCSGPNSTPTSSTQIQLGDAEPSAAFVERVPASPTAAPTEPSQPVTATAEPTASPFLPTATSETTATPEPTPTLLPPLSGSGGGVIAFVSERGGSPGIFIMNADGSDQRQLTAEFDTHPDWSPDGQQIAFSTRRSGVVAIYKIDLSDYRVSALTNTDRAPSAPDWSPDGKRFAMIYNPAHPGIDYELFLMNANGRNFVQLTDSAGYQTYASPDWSPDGNQIVFSADLAGNYDIYLMDPDGSNVRQLTFDEADDRAPAWSPDGSTIAFETYRDGNWEIYAMTADGANLVNLTNSPSRELWPGWSPDGSRIAFQTDRDGNWEIYLMNADGGEPLRLTENEAKDSEPAWRP